MKQKIAIKYCNGIVLPSDGEPMELSFSMSFISEMMAYGYAPDKELADALAELSDSDLATLYLEVIPLLKKSVGAHVKHKPFYPNFPEQVMEADEATLYQNALIHYWTQGKWSPDFTVNDRPVAFENVKFKSLGIITESELDDVFTEILESADSISGFSKEVVEWFVDSGRALNVPDVIPFKENICLLAGIYLKNDMWNVELVKDTTDVLRILTYLNDGDISLAEDTKFKSLPRKVRRVLTNSLAKVAREEDFLRHKNKWIKALHNLHVGDYSKQLYGMAKKLRENEKIETFAGKFEVAIQHQDWDNAIKLGQQRPGIFARNIARMVSSAGGDGLRIIRSFGEVVDQVPARNLLQLWGSVKTRNSDVSKRVVFPKGVVQHAYVLRNTLARWSPDKVKLLTDLITDSLTKTFSTMGELGNVFIDPALYECPLPTGMRSASEGLKEVARGTRMPIGNKDTLRFFIYWKGQDIDLSATYHDEKFNLVDQVSYTRLRAGSGIKSCHSGDITYAPNGASEFIDVDIASALASSKNIRYIAMNVFVFSGPTFAEHEECFAGWMTRNNPGSNEIYEPKTVDQKVDLRSASKNVIPVIFDLKERKAIWADISTNAGRHDTSNWCRSANNVENNKATIRDMVSAFASLDNKITLGELFELHAKARGTIVADKDEALTVFAMDEGITPYDITTINAGFI
jgi:hypothetical protein